MCSSLPSLISFLSVGYTCSRRFLGPPPRCLSLLPLVAASPSVSSALSPVCVRKARGHYLSRGGHVRWNGGVCSELWGTIASSGSLGNSTVRQCLSSDNPLCFNPHPFNTPQIRLLIIQCHVNSFPMIGHFLLSGLRWPLSDCQTPVTSTGRGKWSKEIATLSVNVICIRLFLPAALIHVVQDWVSGFGTALGQKRSWRWLTVFHFIVHIHVLCFHV